MASGPAFDYGNLLSAQVRGNYGSFAQNNQGVQAAQAVLGNTQNWASLAAQTSQSSAARDVATINAAAQTAQQGISSYGNLASSVVNAYGGIAQQGIASKANVRTAELAIEQEKVRRGGGIVGPLLGAAVGVAGLFAD
jgi:L-fucose isomerase-like protein